MWNKSVSQTEDSGSVCSGGSCTTQFIKVLIGAVGSLRARPTSAPPFTSPRARGWSSGRC